jgi:hypothetical protein
MALPAFDNVGGDLPVVGIDPLDMASPSQGLQAADMATNEGFRILLSLKAVADALQVPARPVDTIVLLGTGRDVAVRGPWTGDNGCHFDDHVLPHPRSIRLASLNSM